MLQINQKLESQKENSKWHTFVEGNLILKQGLVDKRKGLFARRRMLLLTMGPHMYYVDPTNMVLKGEIPWSSTLRVEARNFKIFLVHTVSWCPFLCAAINNDDICTISAQPYILLGRSWGICLRMVQSNWGSEETHLWTRLVTNEELRSIIF